MLKKLNSYDVGLFTKIIFSYLLHHDGVESQMCIPGPAAHCTYDLCSFLRRKLHNSHTPSPTESNSCHY